MSIFKDEVLAPALAVLNGQVTQRAVHLQRIRNHVGIRNACYTLIGGNTGSGKTSLVDDVFALSPATSYIYETDTMKGLKVVTLYRSMERRRQFKLTKWACWYIYQATQGKVKLDVNTILGWRHDHKLTTDQYTLLCSVEDWADQLLDYVDVVDGRVTPSELRRYILTYALKNGYLYTSNELEWWSVNDPSIRGLLTVDPKTNTSSVELEYNGVTKVLGQNSQTYFPIDPEVVVQIILDHIGKILSDPGQSAKQKVDETSNVLSEARDVFGYSPVVISQFNRSIGDTQRMKYADGDLAPILEDFKESGNTQEDADLVLALFNPFRYKAGDQHGNYKGYNLSNMINPEGYNLFRLCSILKNSFGADDLEYGLLFEGGVSRFTTMPKVGDAHALTQLYSMVQHGHNLFM